MPIIVNKQFELGKTKEYRLSIQVDLNGFSFSIVNELVNKCQYLYGSDFSLESTDFDTFLRKTSQLIDSTKILSANYKSVNVIYNTEKYALVPLSDFKPEESHIILQKLHTLGEYEEIDHVVLKNEGIVIIFAVNSSLLNCIKTVQPKFNVIPSIHTPIVNLSTYEDHNKIFFQFFKGLLHVVVFEGEKLIFCNSFPALHFNTALYFILLVLKQVHFNPEFTTIFTSGNIQLNDINDLTKYFSKIKYFRSRNISLGSSENELKYSLLAF